MSTVLYIQWKDANNFTCVVCLSLIRNSKWSCAYTHTQRSKQIWLQLKSYTDEAIYCWKKRNILLQLGFCPIKSFEAGKQEECCPGTCPYICAMLALGLRKILPTLPGLTHKRKKWEPQSFLSSLSHRGIQKVNGVYNKYTCLHSSPPTFHDTHKHTEVTLCSCRSTRTPADYAGSLKK